MTGTSAELAEDLSLDLAIGITGWICDERRGAHLSPLVRDIPAERLMIETDAPYLEPEPRSLRRNEPGLLPRVVRRLCEIRGWSPEEADRITTANARELFRLPI